MKEQAIIKEGVVIEELGNSMFKVQLDMIVAYQEK